MHSTSNCTMPHQPPSKSLKNQQYMTTNSSSKTPQKNEKYKTCDIVYFVGPVIHDELRHLII